IAAPPGIRDAGRVVRVSFAYDDGNGGTYAMPTTSYPMFRAVAGIRKAFAAMAAVRTDSETVGTDADGPAVAVVAASGEYFSALGVQPVRGRLYGPGDDVPPVGNDVAVIGYAYWQRAFAGAASAIGSTIVVGGRRLTVIGVTPRGFNGADLAPADVFIPLSTAQRNAGGDWWNNPGMLAVNLIAKLADGVSPAQASAAVVGALRVDPTGVMRSPVAAVPLESVVPGASARESTQGRIALWLSGVSLVVLLIATANVGTLLQLRAARRRRDVAVRVALGARPGHLAREILAESVTLAVAGAGIGLLLARWFDAIVRTTLLPTLAPTERVFDGGVLVASLALAGGAGVVAGLGALRQAWRRNVTDGLRAGPGHGASDRFGLHRALVGVQVALCTVLLVGAGLFVLSLRRVQSQDLGFSTAHLLLVELDYRGALRGLERDLAHEDAARRLAQLPGVARATVAQGMPFGAHNIPPVAIDGYQLPPPNVAQLPIMYAATPAYLSMMGVTLVRGRLFTARDDRAAPLVALVNETFARTAWSGQDPIGKCLRAGFAEGGAGPQDDPMQAAAFLPCRAVVGVVRDSRARSLRTEGGEAKLMQYYVPFEQAPPPPVPNASSITSLLVEAQGDPAALAPAVQRLVRQASTVPVTVRARPYQELIDPQLRSWRLGATLFTAFGALALAIAAVGLHATVAYLTAQRTREIGVRLALGGSGARVSRLVVADALRMAAIGAGTGVAVAMALAPLVQSLLFGTSAREPAVAAFAVAVLLGVTICAALGPSWRASRVSPMEVLRTDA
ncbi:MAG TPA: ABC transporter permease, partial [Gemmatimonadaceae bacterium]|nr:ABC transporter permease [Gemmatimonadaceae bacterium]